MQSKFIPPEVSEQYSIEEFIGRGTRKINDREACLSNGGFGLWLRLPVLE